MTQDLLGKDTIQQLLHVATGPSRNISGLESVKRER